MNQNNSLDVEFMVVGEPATAGSKKGFPIRRSNGTLGVVITDTSGQRGKNWRMAVQSSFMAAAPNHELIIGACELHVVFYFSRPKSHYGTGKGAKTLKKSADACHTKKPDITKLLRAVEDALNGIAWKDDSQIISQQGRKAYCDISTPSHAVVRIVQIVPLK